MEEKLIKLLDNSYSPYSKFRVAAIVVMNDDKEFCGVNVENASYGASICAERSAILSAISNGYKKNDFKAIYIMCDSEKISTPCFLCRMTLSELFTKEKQVICMNKNGDSKTYTVEELCPYPFGEEDLI